MALSVIAGELYSVCPNGGEWVGPLSPVRIDHEGYVGPFQCRTHDAVWSEKPTDTAFAARVRALETSPDE